MIMNKTQATREAWPKQVEGAEQAQRTEDAFDSSNMTLIDVFNFHIAQRVIFALHCLGSAQTAARVEGLFVPGVPPGRVKQIADIFDVLQKSHLRHVAIKYILEEPRLAVYHKQAKLWEIDNDSQYYEKRIAEQGFVFSQEEFNWTRDTLLPAVNEFLKCVYPACVRREQVLLARRRQETVINIARQRQAPQPEEHKETWWEWFVGKAAIPEKELPEGYYDRSIEEQLSSVQGSWTYMAMQLATSLCTSVSSQDALLQVGKTLGGQIAFGSAIKATQHMTNMSEETQKTCIKWIGRIMNAYLLTVSPFQTFFGATFVILDHKLGVGMPVKKGLAYMIEMMLHGCQKAIQAKWPNVKWEDEQIRKVAVDMALSIVQGGILVGGREFGRWCDNGLSETALTTDEDTSKQSFDHPDDMFCKDAKLTHGPDGQLESYVQVCKQDRGMPKSMLMERFQELMNEEFGKDHEWLEELVGRFLKVYRVAGYNAETEQYFFSSDIPKDKADFLAGEFMRDFQFRVFAAENGEALRAQLRSIFTDCLGAHEPVKVHVLECHAHSCTVKTEGTVATNTTGPEVLKLFMGTYTEGSSEWMTAAGSIRTLVANIAALQHDAPEFGGTARAALDTINGDADLLDILMKSFEIQFDLSGEDAETWKQVYDFIAALKLRFLKHSDKTVSIHLRRLVYWAMGGLTKEAKLKNLMEYGIRLTLQTRQAALTAIKVMAPVRYSLNTLANDFPIVINPETDGYFSGYHDRWRMVIGTFRAEWQEILGTTTHEIVHGTQGDGMNVRLGEDERFLTSIDLLDSAGTQGNRTAPSEYGETEGEWAPEAIRLYLLKLLDLNILKPEELEAMQHDFPHVDEPREQMWIAKFIKVIKDSISPTHESVIRGHQNIEV